MTKHIRLNNGEITEIAQKYEGRSPQDVLRWMVERFGSRARVDTGVSRQFCAGIGRNLAAGLTLLDRRDELAIYNNLILSGV